jgi:hypothetical protein
MDWLYLQYWLLWTCLDRVVWALVILAVSGHAQMWYLAVSWLSGPVRVSQGSGEWQLASSIWHSDGIWNLIRGVGGMFPTVFWWSSPQPPQHL